MGITTFSPLGGFIKLFQQVGRAPATCGVLKSYFSPSFPPSSLPMLVADPLGTGSASSWELRHWTRPWWLWDQLPHGLANLHFILESPPWASGALPVSAKSTLLMWFIF